MKNIIYLFFLFLLPACKKSFLEIYPETSLSEGTYYKTESDFISLANGCYIPKRDNDKTNTWVIAELIADNGYKQYNAVTGEPFRGIIDQLNLASDNNYFAGFWDLSYNGVARCNKLLSEMEKRDITWSNAALKERTMGEAYFLRALYYFDLVRQYGGVPLVVKPVTAKESVEIKRSSEEDVYKIIVSDLKTAIIHFEKAENVKENGRANLGAAGALLGKVYLTLHNYSEAKPILESVIGSGKYSLLSNYANLFDPANKDFTETIFAVQYAEVSADLANNFIFWFAPGNSGGNVTKRPNVSLLNTGGNNTPTSDLIDAFEAGDARKDVSIKYWTGTDWDGVVRPLPYCGKFKPPVSSPDNRCSDNLPILRYSDVLLMYAEVLNNLGNTVQAIPYVEQVRNRAGLMNSLSGYNRQTLDSLIAKERQKEFCFENQRWYDLKRTGKAMEVMTAHGIRHKATFTFLPANAYQIDKNKLLAPIPAQQVLLNKLIQNPGY